VGCIILATDKVHLMGPSEQGIERRMPSSGMLRHVALVTTQKTAFFIVTAVKTSILTRH
jgi:hypothetical protein